MVGERRSNARTGGTMANPDKPETQPASEAWDVANAEIARRAALESHTAIPGRIGAYRFLERVGAGGMGEVYLAEQVEPIRRRVALKLIKLGMDTREVIARFDSERQALALMSHPNVAAVYDAGATELGRPYFVMEYVAGEP